MTANNAWLSENLRLCSYSRNFVQLAGQTIFSRITELTTPAQFEAAHQSLLALCERLEQQVDLFHFPIQTGTHSCVRDVYTLAAFSLKNLALMQPPPALPPAPRQQLITIEGVVIEMEEQIYTSREETDLGTQE